MQFLARATALPGVPQKDMGSCKLTGKLTPLFPSWGLCRTRTPPPPFPYKTNSVHATQIFKRKPRYKGGIHTQHFKQQKSKGMVNLKVRIQMRLGRREKQAPGQEPEVLATLCSLMGVKGTWVLT